MDVVGSSTTVHCDVEFEDVHFQKIREPCFLERLRRGSRYFWPSLM